MKPALLLIIGCCLLALSTAQADFSLTDREALLRYTRALLLHRLGEPSDIHPPQAATAQRACFITVFSRQQVVACFGSFTPRRSMLGDEISENIRLALSNDPRAQAMTTAIARSADIQITFPGTPQRIDDWRRIDPQREGLFVEAPDGRGVAIVPGEARTASYAYRSAMKRLGLRDGAPGTQLYRFKAQVISTRTTALQ